MQRQTMLSRVFERAHDRVYRLHPDNATLIRTLTEALGRSTVTRLTGAPDQKTVTRWSLGRNEPAPERLSLLRDAAVFYFALLELGLTAASAEQWFRGAHPSLGFAMPVDAIRDRRYADVAAAVGNHLPQ